MSSDDFSTKYRLLRQIAVGPVRSYTAQERASGRPVLVHFVDDQPPSAPGSVLPRLDRLSPQDKPKILDSARVAGATVVITPVLESFSTLEDWLSTRSRSAPVGSPPPRDLSTPVNPCAPVPSSVSEPGEFTRLFGQPVSGSTGVSAPREAPRPFERSEPAAGAGWLPGGGSDPIAGLDSPAGEFTRWFAREDVTPPPARTTAQEPSPGHTRPIDPPAPDESPASAAGEFTRLFAPPGAASGAEVRTNDVEPSAGRMPPPSAARDEPGEYTRLFPQPSSSAAQASEAEERPRTGEGDRPGSVPLLRLRVPLSPNAPPPLSDPFAPSTLPDPHVPSAIPEPHVPSVSPTPRAPSAISDPHVPSPGPPANTPAPGRYAESPSPFPYAEPRSAIDAPFAGPPASRPLGWDATASIPQANARSTLDELSAPSARQASPLLGGSPYILDSQAGALGNASPFPEPSPTFTFPAPAGSEPGAQPTGPSEFTRVIEAGSPTATEPPPAAAVEAVPAAETPAKRNVVVPILIALIVIEAIVIVFLVV